MREAGESFEASPESAEPEPVDSRASEASDYRQRLLGRSALEHAESTDAVPEVAPRRFETDQAAVDYGREHWNETLAHLSPEQREAVQVYSRQLDDAERFVDPELIDYRDINGALQGRESMTPEIRTRIDDIDAALNTHPTTEPLEVTRATGIDHWSFDPADAAGQRLTEEGYLSTSLGRPASGFESKPVILHLQVPEGTPALYLGGDTTEYEGAERELLLGRGREWEADRSEFSADDGRWHVYGRVIR